MKLYGSTRSPYTRKVLIAAHELGIAGAIALRPVVASLTRSDPELMRIHPLGQIPALVLADGRVVHDSLVICEYLDALHGPYRLLPQAGQARWEVLSRHALGQALLETLVRLFSERKRTGDPLQPSYVDAAVRRFRRTLPALEEYSRARAARPQPASFDLGDICLGCALSYADFRFPEQDWRAGHPALATYFAEISARPALRANALEGEGTP